MALLEPEGKLEFDRVFFTSYGSNKPTVNGISFVIEPGNVVGVIGANASGKSTIAKLIVGVWKPISDVVRLDDADVYTWNRENLVTMLVTYFKILSYLTRVLKLILLV